MPSPSPARKHRWLRICRRAVVTLATLYLLVVLMMMFLEESLLFFPIPYPGGQWQIPGFHPVDAEFEAEDGTRLHGWYMPHENPRGVILFCHGNAGNVTHRADILYFLHDRVGASVLVFDYRGYGRSNGSPNERGVLQDARAARAWLARQQSIPENHIVLMGESLGGAVAVDLAAADGARALILQSTFTSVPDVAAYYYPWLPVRWLIRNRFDSLGKIASYHGPLLQVHSRSDTIILYQFGRRLFEAANQPKQFVELKGLDHNDPHIPEYYDKIIQFLDEVNASGGNPRETPQKP